MQQKNQLAKFRKHSQTLTIALLVSSQEKIISSSLGLAIIKNFSPTLSLSMFIVFNLLDLTMNTKRASLTLINLVLNIKKSLKSLKRLLN